MTSDRFGRRHRRRSTGARRWAATLVATAVSMLAIDITATAAGVALASSTVFSDAGSPVLVTVVVWSYLCWIVGLINNLLANSRLLDAAGVSTNAVSKLAHDLAGNRSAARRRTAATWGYVSTEIVKELPYVIGAFGAAAASASIGRRDALVFLTGANLGAACYELATAAGTRLYLRHHPGAEASAAEIARPS